MLTQGIIYLKPQPPTFSPESADGTDLVPEAGAPESTFYLCLPDKQTALRAILLELEDWDSRFDSADTIAEAILAHLFEAALKSAMNTPHKPLKEKPKVKQAAKKAAIPSKTTKEKI